MNYKSNQRGSITLVMVFGTAMVLFLLVFADHVTAMKEEVSAQSDTATEQAFYSAQSCLEEGYLQLRTDANYPGGEIAVGQTSCQMTAQSSGQPDTGILTTKGVYHDRERTTTSYYTGAGPAQSRNNTTIYHILDRSGSMANDGYGCTIPGYPNQADCLAHEGVWGVQPSTTVRAAAKLFIDRLDQNFDKIGVVSYNEQVTLDYPAANDFNQAKTVIDNLAPPGGFTNIGDALKTATANLILEPPEQARFEILLTDGEANRPDPAPAPAHNAKEYALNKASEAKSMNIVIFAIGLGNHYDENFLRDVASTVDGEVMYFRAPQATDLEEIYDRIAGIIISYNIDQANWREE
jgi:hypothetical protein